MKKIIILCKLVVLSAIFLVGCSDNNRSVDSMLKKEVEVKHKEVMDDQVKVYSNHSNGDGFVVKVDGRDKWIVTEASIISEHPKALIQTSNDQILEGDITAYNIEQNAALIHIRNSAEVKPSTDAGVWNKQGIDELLDQQHSLTYQESIELLNAFKDAKKPSQYNHEPFEQYKKDTFTYNPALIEAFIHTFQKQYELYLQNGEKETIAPYIGSDLLMKKIEKSYKASKSTLKFSELIVNSINLVDFQYIVQVEFVMNKKKSKKNVQATYKLIQVDNELKVISMQWDE